MHPRSQPSDPEYSSTESVTEGRFAAEHRTWLTAAEAAQYLHVKARTILLWARQGKVKAYALSGSRRVHSGKRLAEIEFRVSELPAKVHGRRRIS
jgi:excisionase family DNA binding protein